MQNDIDVLIIEDEPMWSQMLANNLVSFGFNVAAIAENFEDAIKALNTPTYDIVLLDININGRNSGIELGKMISSLFDKPFIFVTGSFDSHTAQQAIESKPSGYLVKPVNPISLFVSIQSAINNFNNKVVAASQKVTGEETESFFVKMGDKYRKIFWKDVVYLSSEKNYTAVYNAADKLHYHIRSTMPKTLKYIVPAHMQALFIQVNRSEVLQVSYVQELISDEAKTPFKTFLVTEAYYKELKARLNIVT